MGADITIIIPTRDRLWALPKAVDSCASTGLAIEIIVVDDASRDGTAEWLRQRTDVIAIQGHGWGKPWGVNAAMGLASGKYVRFLDSDDWLNPGANERQYAIGECEGADVVIAGFDEYDDDRFVGTQPWILTDDFIAQQLGEVPNVGHYSACLFRREFVHDIPHRTLFPGSDFASRDDRCFLLEVALRHPRVVLCEMPSLCHREHRRGRLQAATSFGGAGTNIQQLYIFRQILRLLDEAGELTPRRRRAVTTWLWFLAHGVGRTDPGEGRAIADWVYRLDPGFVPGETGLLGYLYRHLGFAATEWLLRLRRRLLRSLIRRRVAEYPRPAKGSVPAEPVSAPR